MDEWIINNSTRRRKEKKNLCMYYLIFEKGKVLLFYKEWQKRDYKKSFIWLFFNLVLIVWVHVCPLERKQRRSSFCKLETLSFRPKYITIVFYTFSHDNKALIKNNRFVGTKWLSMYRLCCTWRDYYTGSKTREFDLLLSYNWYSYEASSFVLNWFSLLSEMKSIHLLFCIFNTHLLLLFTFFLVYCFQL